MSHQDGVGGGSNGGDSNVPTSPSLSTSSGHSEQQSTPRPQLPRSLSRGSSVSVLSSAADNVPQHHHYGTSYFANAPGSSVLGGGRPSSPPPAPSGSGRRPSYRPNAPRSLSSTSVTHRQTQRIPSTVRRREESVDEEADDDLEDEEADDEVAELRARAHADDADIEEGGGVDDEDIDPITLKQRQSLINVEHPFGLPIWKPALYKKTRSVTRHADQALHSIPSAQAERHLAPGNVAWTLLFGWWLSLACGAVSLVLYVIPRGGRRYSRLVFGLAWYLFWPFGKFVEGNIRTGDEAKGDADEAETEETRPQSVATADGHGSVSPRRRGMTHTHSVSWIPPLSPGERTSLLSNGGNGLANGNGTPQQVLIAPVRSYGATSSSGYDEDTDIKSARAQDFIGKIAYWLLLTSIIAPLLLIVCLICWGLVITIPMAKLNWALLKYLFGRADSIRFCAAPPVIVLPSPPANEHQLPAESNTQEQADTMPAPPPIIQSASLTPGQVAPPSSAPTSTVLLCTYKAVGLQYYKYTIGGVNIFFVNLLAVVFFTIFDGFVLLPIADEKKRHGEEIPALLAFFTSRILVFAMALASVIPLSYFLGMAVASISAQSSIGMGAVINATFGSIIEIILYGIMLADGKGRLVEGSIIGSLLAGVLLMPGMSMVSGATRKKEMKFNAQSASVTSTMLIMAIIGTLTPTLFYQTYGNFQLVCEGCPSGGPSNSTDPWTCQHCYYRHPDPVDDPFYQDTVKSLMYFCATILLFSYLIGLWFSLRTHASHIWQKPKATHEIPVPPRLSLYQPQSAPGQAPTTGTGTGEARALRRRASNISTSTAPHSRSTTPTPRTREAVPPSILENAHASGHGSQQGSGHQAQAQIPGLGKRVSYAALPNIAATIQDAGLAVPGANGTNAEMHMSQAEFTRAVTIATVSALRHQAVHSPARARVSGGGGAGGHNAGVIDDGGEHGGHGAPSWSRALSASVLLGCTFLYAIIAEILVDVVDVVLEGSGLDEKFLGVTLFALVPNTTEFMNAMAFAMGGNIALSMEIGSAYALQVCLLQIPAMVAFSAWYTAGGVANAANSFNLIFPRWDVVAVIFSVFLMTYTYIEAKSNYHRGSILILSYLVLTAGFFFAPHRDDDLEEVPEVFGGAVPVSFPQTVQYLANSFFAR